MSRNKTKTYEAPAYVPSQAVAEALAAVENQKAERPGEYQSAWEALLRQSMEQILNRQPFHYNLNGDALYQQYRQQAIRDGRLAMMDTMGQAAAMTGGYGNSYAQTLGQQVYQQNLLKVNDRIPELYAMALDQYRMESQAQQDRYNLIYGREQQDYGRYRDSVNEWQQDASRLWEIYRDQLDFDYGSYRDRVGDQQWQAEFQEAKRRYDQEWEAAQEAAALKAALSAASSSSSGGSSSGTKKKTTTTTPAPAKDNYLVLL